jgi:serine/threonine protein kinase
LLGFKTPYVVKVYDFRYDRNGGFPFFVLEYLPGGDLRKSPGRFSWGQAAKLFNDILTALHVAQSHNSHID